jgi:hypothetical protein
MRFRWPKETGFRRLVLDVEQSCCAQCGAPLHVRDHRSHRIYTLEGPLELCCRLAPCSAPVCPRRPRTLSPAAELALTQPGWLSGWDVFCFIGHRRFARHWSVPQVRDELLDSYRIKLSVAAICIYIRRYQAMVAARQQDFSLLRLAYRDIKSVVLSIDGLQPEKGHEALHAVRELNAGHATRSSRSRPTWTASATWTAYLDSQHAAPPDSNRGMVQEGPLSGVSPPGSVAGLSVRRRTPGGTGGSRHCSLAARPEVAGVLATAPLLPRAAAVPRGLCPPFRRPVHGPVGRLRAVRHAGRVGRGQGRVQREPHALHSGEGNEFLAASVGNNSVLVLEGPHARQRRVLLPPLKGERMRSFFDAALPHERAQEGRRTRPTQWRSGEVAFVTGVTPWPPSSCITSATSPPGPASVAKLSSAFREAKPFDALQAATLAASRSWPVGRTLGLPGPMQQITLRVILQAVLGLFPGPQLEEVAARVRRVLELGRGRYG